MKELFFPVGQYDNDNDNPVLYTIDQFKRLCNEPIPVHVYTGHNKTQELGIVTVYCLDDGLYYENTDNIDFNGYGLSPSFTGDKITTNGVDTFDKLTLDHIARTRNPRSGIIHNNNIGDDKMSLNAEEIIEKKDNQITTLQEDNAILKKQLEDAQKEAKKVKKLEKQLNEKDKELETLTTANEEYKSDAEAYREYKQNKKDQIIKELFEDDQEAYEQFKDLSLSQLEILHNKQVIDQEPKKHVQADNGDHGDDGEPAPVKEKEIEDLTYEERRKVFGEYGF